MIPKIGQKAPVFTLFNQNGEKVALKDFLHRKEVLLYFYPKAMTPGCTTQACGLRDSFSLYEKSNAVILGVSPDSPEKLKKFAEKYNLPFTLLSDPDHAVAEKYGAWGQKKFMGKSYMGILRYSYIIDREGVLRHVVEKVKTKTHHDDMLEHLQMSSL